MISFRLLGAIFALRLFNALTTVTFFQPDEFFQALEPAHYYVFGYGYVTWEWREHLRLSIHPLIYAAGYKIAQWTAHGNADLEFKLVLLAPKIIGAIIATITEYTTYQFARTYSGSDLVAKYTLALSLLNPFNWYFITRSFSNVFETMLVVLGLRYWWGSTSYKSFCTSVAFGGLSCVVRPTNAILWAYLGAEKVVRSRDVTRKVVLVMLAIVVVGTLLALTAVPDYIFYGELTFPIYNFLEFNVVRNLSLFYGSAPWHFYLTQLIPLMMMAYLPFLARGLYMMRYNSLVHASVVVVLGFSCIGHKEFRFIYPLQPIMLMVCGFAVTEVIEKKRQRGGGKQSKSSDKPKSSHKITTGCKTTTGCNISIDEQPDSTTLRNRKKVSLETTSPVSLAETKEESPYRFWTIVLVLTNIAIGFFFTRVNERGVMDIVTTFRNENINNVGFLIPCHSTPWQSHIHDPTLKSWFLTCEPPLHLDLGNARNVREYRDESDRFFDDPRGFWNTMTSSPSRIVVFEPMVAFAESLNGYEECGRYFNSMFHWDDRRRGLLVVYCRSSE